MRFSLSASLILSSVLFPALAVASSPDPASASAQPLRLSTGVTAPALLTPLAVELPSSASKPITGEVVLSILVDEKGTVHDVKVTQSLSSFWDARVVEAVQKGRFRPASLDQQAIPMNVELKVEVSN
jgi:TonB family protein